MTWAIRIIYRHDDGSKPTLSLQQVLTDEMVEDANFDVRVEAFKRLLVEIDKELRNAKN